MSSTTNPYQPTSLNSFSQIVQDFNSIGTALQSGNLSTAQSALATFQQDLQNNSQTSTTQPFGNNSQANTDYQSLTSALQSGDLSGAQKAFSSLQTDLQGAGAGKAHKGHHHHGSGGGASTESLINNLTTSSSTTSTNSTGTTSAADGDAENDGSILNVTA